MPLSLTITPDTDLIDVPRTIRVTGARPGAEVLLTTRTARPGGRWWTSRGLYFADAGGRVDTAMQAPAEAGYDGIDAMGPIWSQSLDGTSCPEMGAIDDLATELEAQSGEETAAARMVQTHLAEGVTRREIAQDGVIGTLFTPAGAGPHPAVVILNGSGGGMNEPRAALYASRGYAALALGYFNAPGLARWINDTPLEYFRDALDWLRAEIAPKDDFVAITGQSRGGELVLLLASLFPERVSAVMAYVPAAYVHSAQSAGDPERGRLAPTWTLDGAPLANLWDGNRTGTYDPYLKGREPLRHEYALLTAMADTRALKAARIPVERITAPLLLVHGTDDGWWPTDYHCDVIEETLAAAGHAYPVERLRFEGAGHAILFPYTPTTEIVRPHPVSGIVSTDGGTAAANARANAESWAGVLDFLERARP